MIKKKIIKILREESRLINKKTKMSNFILRRLDLLDTHITQSYHWLDPKRFKDFDDYLNRVIFSTTREFTSDLGIYDYQEILKLRDELEEDIKNIIISKYLREIKHHYNSHK
jgi:hypothetical protein